MSDDFNRNTWTTATEVDHEKFSLALFKEAMRAINRETAPVDAFLITGGMWVSSDHAMLAAYQGKKYMIVHKDTWEKLLEKAHEQGILIRTTKESPNIYATANGIAVIEDDELVKKILQDVLEKWQERIDAQARLAAYEMRVGTTWPPKFDLRDFGPSGS